MQCRSSLASDVPNDCLCGAAMSCEVCLSVTRPKHSSQGLLMCIGGPVLKGRPFDLLKQIC